MADGQSRLVDGCHVTGLAAESVGCGHRGCVLVRRGGEAAWEGGEAASRTLEHQHPLLEGEGIKRENMIYFGSHKNY